MDVANIINKITSLSKYNLSSQSLSLYKELIKKTVNTFGCIEVEDNYKENCSNIEFYPCSDISFNLEANNQKYNKYLDLKVSNIVGGKSPYTVSWVFDNKAFIGEKINDPLSLKLLKLQDNLSEFNWITNVSVNVMDNSGCVSTKIIQLTFSKSGAGYTFSSTITSPPTIFCLSTGDIIDTGSGNPYNFIVSEQGSEDHLLTWTDDGLHFKIQSLTNTNTVIKEYNFVKTGFVYPNGQGNVSKYKLIVYCPNGLITTITTDAP